MTRLAQWMDRAMEGLWLAALVYTPLFFNVYSSRVFEPDKVALLRAIVALAAVCWARTRARGSCRAGASAQRAAFGVG